MRLLIKAFVVLNLTACASIQPIETKEVSLQFNKYLPGASYPLITANGLEGRRLNSGLGLNLNTAVFRDFYWNNQVETRTDKDFDGNGQFRTVAYKYAIGWQMLDFLSVEFLHRSEHVLDHTYPYSRFPQENGIGVKIDLYKGKEK